MNNIFTIHTGTASSPSTAAQNSGRQAFEDAQPCGFLAARGTRAHQALQGRAPRQLDAPRAKRVPRQNGRGRIYEAALAEDGATYRTVAQRFRVTSASTRPFSSAYQRMCDVRRAGARPAWLHTFSLRQLLGIARLDSDRAKREAFAVVAFQG